jgi:hypothetical protein
MGYDLHIHRAATWLDPRDNPITLEEWRAYVNAHSDFRMDNFAEADLGDEGVLRVEGEGLAVWTGHPSSDTAWFYYADGEITVKNPDEHLRRKMFEVGTSLGARVQGDDIEFYGPDGEPLPQDSEDRAGSTRQGFLARLFGRS